MNTPKIRSIWEHYNGQKYRIIILSNMGGSDVFLYPPTIVYQNINNGSIWNRELSDWERSMTWVSDEPLMPEFKLTTSWACPHCNHNNSDTQSNEEGAISELFCTECGVTIQLLVNEVNDES